MGLDDFRRWIDVGARDGSEGAVALEVTTAGKLAVRTMGGPHADGSGFHEGEQVDLDYSDAGLLLDALREGMGVLLARTGHPSAIAAVAGVRLARDTPGEG